MKCRFCSKKAIITTESGPLCKDHFREFYLRRIQRTIDKYRMFSKNDKILVAVSGGKDSTALAYALYELGYEFEGLYINLGIPNYSTPSEKAARKLFEKIGYKLNVVDVWKDYHVKVQRVGRRPVCSVCGTIKRYIMNRFAYENGFTVVATAHNLNDEAAFFLNNLFSNKIEYLAKQGPVNPPREKLVKKVKPLYFSSEKENLVYALINDLPIYHAECPFARNNTQEKWKELVVEIERKRPGFTRNFVRSMLNLIKHIKIEEKLEWKFCKVCGYPTGSKDGICAFCKLQMKFKERANKT